MIDWGVVMSKKNRNNKLNRKNKTTLNRSRSENRYNYFKSKNRKLNILYSIHGKSDIDSYYTDKKKGKLGKGKIHCSCSMCSIKSKDSLKISDLKNIYKLNSDLNENLLKLSDDIKENSSIYYSDTYDCDILNEIETDILNKYLK